jgi:hypothetical protein
MGDNVKGQDGSDFGVDFDQALFYDKRNFATGQGRLSLRLL